MLTDKQIKSLKLKKSSYYETDDTSRRGYGRLAIKVSSAGEKAFYFLYRFNKERKFLPLGNYNVLSLQDARQLSNNYGQMVFDGKDPRAFLEYKQQKIEEAKTEEKRKSMEGNVKQLFDLFIEKTKKDNSDEYYKAVKCVLSGEVLTSLGSDTKANTIESCHIASALRPISARESLVMTNRARSYLSAAFNYGRKFDFSPQRRENDPIFNIKYRHRS